MLTKALQKKHHVPALFAVCLNNTGFPASLEVYKIYRILPDPQAALNGDLRVIDESGEDYLYSDQYFALIELPEVVENALLKPA